MYSNEYRLENCLDLAEWAIDVVMYTFKSDKHDKASRLLSASTINSGRQSKTQNKRQKQQQSILPTIKDETEIKQVHSRMEKNAEEEMDNLIRKSKRDNLFGKQIF
jgi:D-arabinose 1-dehydrogenase-like Zn-dependent alcohol dehydrogenase